MMTLFDREIKQFCTVFIGDVMRKLSKLDLGLANFQKTLLAFQGKTTATRQYPAYATKETTLSLEEKRHAAGLMRVNHVGEVCAQALYQGQALTARQQVIKAKMETAALEEEDHLAWCAKRLNELDSRVSYLNPVWYLGALTLGLIAGLCGDKWSLGFVAETEEQVTRHLAAHLAKIPLTDEKTRVVVEQMKTDEMQHKQEALSAGGVELPSVIKKLMTVCAKLMTSTAYYI